jgi:alanyl-tRNA synthetase
MTERLYYKEPGLLEFDANVIESGMERDKPFVILDRTAFYPTSGGQLHDTGLLNTVRVLGVVVDEQENIKHITETSIDKKSVHGKIDYERRQYFRQLHTAQHILSAAFIELFNLETVSVHLGEDYGAIELLTAELSLDQCTRAEQFAILELEKNAPVEIIFAGEKESVKLPLRKKPDRSGTIRVIKIGDLDWSACGGTHCNTTAEVGLIKLIGVEKQRGNALVKFLAGKKAFEDYEQRFAITDELTKSLTCAVGDLPDKFDKLASENKELRKQLLQLQSELIPIRAESLAKQVEQTENHNLVVRIVTDIDPKQLNQLASQTAKTINGVAALLLENRLCLAISDKSELDAGKIVKLLSEKFGLKGGGGKTLAQLGGVMVDDIEAYKKELIAIINAKT